MSELAHIARALNKKSDSANALISRFQIALGSMNIGLEVWPDEAQLDSEPWIDAGNAVYELNNYQRGTVRTQFGFTNDDGKWVLATRRAYYEGGNGPEDGILDQTDTVTPLLEASRDQRLAALRFFPQIVEALQTAAEAAIKRIEKAEEFVSAVDRDKATFADLAVAIFPKAKNKKSPP